jgi:hypothetical protein
MTTLSAINVAVYSSAPFFDKFGYFQLWISFEICLPAGRQEL